MSENIRIDERLEQAAEGALEDLRRNGVRLEWAILRARIEYLRAVIDRLTGDDGLGTGEERAVEAISAPERQWCPVHAYADGICSWCGVRARPRKPKAQKLPG